MADQRLPIVNSDDGTWGDILRQYLQKEHYDDGTNNAANGGHKNITIRGGTAGAGGAPLKFTSGTLLTTPEAGAMEFAGDNLYLTQTSATTRKKVALYDDTSGATGDMYYRNASGYFARLAAGTASQILTMSGGVPSWQTPAASGLAGSTGSTDNAILRADGTGGTTAQGSVVTIADTTGNMAGVGTINSLTLPASNFVGLIDSQTLTNKRITPRVVTVAQSATPSIATDTGDVFIITGLAQNITSITVTGTPTDSQRIRISITGTAARTISWGSSFEASTKPLPTTTVSTNRLDTNFIWNATTSKWRVADEIASTVYVTNGTDVAVADGGTGRSTSTTAYGIIAAGTTATGAQQTISPGTSGQFLKSAGASALASFATITAADISGTTAQFNAALSDNDFATLAGTEVLTNKTLTSPKIGTSILDTNGNAMLGITPAASAVNHLSIANTAAGGSPYISADGSDTNININLIPKGAGGVLVYSHTGNASTIQAVGDDTNISLNLLSQGTGRVQANGVDIPTVNSSDVLTNKTLASPKIDTLYNLYGSAVIELWGSFTPANRLAISNNDTNAPPFISALGTDTNISIGVSPKGTGGIQHWQESGNVAMYRIDGPAANIDFGVAPKGAGGLKVYMTTGQSTAKVAADGDDANISLNLASKGTGRVQANGVNIPTTSSSDTLTNKLLSGSDNTFSNIPQSAVTNLSTDMGNTVKLTGDQTISGVKTVADTNPKFVINNTSGTNASVASLQLLNSSINSGIRFNAEVDGSDTTGWIEKTDGSGNHVSDYMRFGAYIIGFANNRLTDLSDPVNTQDAATKNYVDSKVNRISKQDYNSGTGTIYFKVATLPIDDAGNKASVMITGRLGGWVGNDSVATSSILLSNRSTTYTGTTISASVFGQGKVSNALSAMDIVVYGQSDKSAIVYIAVPASTSYAFDLILSTVQATPGYTGTSETPVGTSLWRLSQNPQIIQQDGVLSSTNTSTAAWSMATVQARSSGGNTGVQIGSTFDGAGNKYGFIDLTDGNGTYPSEVISFDTASVDMHNHAVINIVDPYNPQDAATKNYVDSKSGLSWVEVTSTTQTAAVGTGYITNSVGIVTVTLPATAAVGKSVRIAGKGSGGWRVAQNAGQVIRFGNMSTTSGISGRLDSTNRYDTLELICITANTEWIVTSSVGNISVV